MSNSNVVPFPQITLETRRYGIYDGGVFLNNSVVQTCSEPILYALIFALSERISKLQEKSNLSEMAKKELESYEYGIDFCAINTQRFGVEIEIPEPGERVLVTPSYLAWYEYWDKYFQDQLPPEAVLTFTKKARNGEDVSFFHPEGNWKDNVEE